MLIVNADDWGSSERTTDRILDCRRKGRVDTVSAMVFMEDSERAAQLAWENRLESGLHVNLTQELTAPEVDGELRVHHRCVASFLNARKLNQVLYNPRLRESFRYVFQAQWQEFSRLYGTAPARVDGHHHMHLCMNILAARLIPDGLRVRKSFTFGAGEKDLVNRLYRAAVNRWLSSHFQTADFFFSIIPLDIQRHRRIIELSRSAMVELMAHPGVEAEYQYLMSQAWMNLVEEGN